MTLMIINSGLRTIRLLQTTPRITPKKHMYSNVYPENKYLSNHIKPQNRYPITKITNVNGIPHPSKSITIEPDNKSNIYVSQ